MALEPPKATQGADQASVPDVPRMAGVGGAVVRGDGTARRWRPGTLPLHDRRGADVAGTVKSSGSYVAWAFCLLYGA